MAERPTNLFQSGPSLRTWESFALTDAICAAHLNDDYAELSRELAAGAGTKTSFGHQPEHHLHAVGGGLEVVERGVVSAGEVLAAPLAA